MAQTPRAANNLRRGRPSKLTFWQARRLWNLDDEVCEQALAELVAAKFLYCTPDGRFIRRGVGPLCGSLRESSPRCDA
jgi:hypothetical protein